MRSTPLVGWHLPPRRSICRVTRVVDICSAQRARSCLTAQQRSGVFDRVITSKLATSRPGRIYRRFASSQLAARFTFRKSNISTSVRHLRSSCVPYGYQGFKETGLLVANSAHGIDAHSTSCRNIRAKTDTPISITQTGRNVTGSEALTRKGASKSEIDYSLAATDAVRSPMRADSSQSVRR
jgi:hypothetical protein